MNLEKLHNKLKPSTLIFFDENNQMISYETLKNLYISQLKKDFNKYHLIDFDAYKDEINNNLVNIEDFISNMKLSDSKIKSEECRRNENNIIRYISNNSIITKKNIGLLLNFINKLHKENKIYDVNRIIVELYSNDNLSIEDIININNKFNLNINIELLAKEKQFTVKDCVLLNEEIRMHLKEESKEKETRLDFEKYKENYKFDNDQKNILMFLIENISNRYDLTIPDSLLKIEIIRTLKPEYIKNLILKHQFENPKYENLLIEILSDEKIRKNDSFYIALLSNNLYDKLKNKVTIKNKENENLFMDNILKKDFEEIKKILIETKDEDVETNFIKHFLYKKYKFKSDDLNPKNNKEMNLNIYKYSYFTEHKMTTNFIKFNINTVNLYRLVVKEGDNLPQSLINELINLSIKRKNDLLANTIISKININESQMKKFINYDNLYYYKDIDIKFLEENYNKLTLDNKKTILANQKNISNRLKDKIYSDMNDSGLSTFLLSTNFNYFKENSEDVLKNFNLNMNYNSSKIVQLSIFNNMIKENKLDFKATTQKDLEEYNNKFYFNKIEVIQNKTNINKYNQEISL